MQSGKSNNDIFFEGLMSLFVCFPDQSQATPCSLPQSSMAFFPTDQEEVVMSHPWGHNNTQRLHTKIDPGQNFAKVVIYSILAFSHVVTLLRTYTLKLIWDRNMWPFLKQSRSNPGPATDCCSLCSFRTEPHWVFRNEKGNAAFLSVFFSLYGWVCYVIIHIAWRPGSADHRDHNHHNRRSSLIDLKEYLHWCGVAAVHVSWILRSIVSEASWTPQMSAATMCYRWHTDPFEPQQCFVLREQRIWFPSKKAVIDSPR